MLLIRQAEIYAESRGAALNNRLDVRCRDGTIVEIAPSLTSAPEEIIIEARGGALLPGLHDHHIHLLALAASHQSVYCGPPIVTNREALAHALEKAGGQGWIRGTGYHESVAGNLHREQLDEWVADRPLRIQHRSGKMWFVNSLAARHLDLDRHRSLDGVECDSSGAPNGRLFRMDQWLRKQLGDESLPDIKATSGLLASYGVTGITDATAANSSLTRELFAELIAKGDLLQRTRLMGNESLISTKQKKAAKRIPTVDLLDTGSLKIMLDDYALPEFEKLKETIVDAHRQECPVAIHCVTAVELVFALSALRETGSHPGDRVEHASVIPEQTISLILDTGITVVTQPNFITEKGDQYISDVDKSELPDLYRTGTLLDAGIPVGGSTDAPFGDPDPWRAIAAAVSRRTSAGVVLGAREQLSPELALRLFTSPPDNPGGSSRTLKIGSDADLCLLDRPWQEIRLRLKQEDVVATIRAGDVIWQSG